MAVTIKDVARETHLAISTISKYLNGGIVREKNRKLIEEAIQRLGYAPNVAARSLRTSKSYMVALLAGDNTNPHAVTVISEAEKKLRDAGYSLVYFSHGGKEARARECIEYMIRCNVDGVLLSLADRGASLAEIEGLRDIPIVAIEENGSLDDTDCVQADCACGSYEAVELLVKAGHKRIAVLGDDSRATFRERLKGYLRVLEDYQYPVYPEYIVKGDYRFESGYEGLRKLWDLRERPTAVFISDYVLALGAMAAVQELSIRIPEELSVVVFDDFELSVMSNPQLTAVRQPLIEMTDAACELLCRRMNGDYSDFPKRIRLKTDCICRASVAEPAKAGDEPPGV